MEYEAKQRTTLAGVTEFCATVGGEEVAVVGASFEAVAPELWTQLKDRESKQAAVAGAGTVDTSGQQPAGL